MLLAYYIIVCICMLILLLESASEKNMPLNVVYSPIWGLRLARMNRKWEHRTSFHWMSFRLPPATDIDDCRNLTEICQLNIHHLTTEPWMILIKYIKRSDTRSECHQMLLLRPNGKVTSALYLLCRWTLTSPAFHICVSVSVCFCQYLYLPVCLRANVNVSLYSASTQKICEVLSSLIRSRSSISQ